MNMRAIQKDFPIFQKYPKLCYLDSAATSQKPKAVIDAIRNFYETSNANIHRGLYHLSQLATEKYENARKRVADFVGAKAEEIIFVRNATEGINLVASVFPFNKKDTVLLTEMEHHANIVPWQMAGKKTGCRLEVVKLTKDQKLDMNDLKKKLEKKPRLVCVTHVSNALGTINPVKTIIELAHAKGSLVLVDASQSVPHMKVHFKDLGADFMVFTGHKSLGPTGIGVVVIKKSIAENLPPYQTGGDMIESVSWKKTTFQLPPHRFEAGTPNIEGAIALASAFDYLESLGNERVREHEKKLFKKAWSALKKEKGITLFGPENEEEHAGIISFTLDGVHPHDIAQVFDSENIAIRAGHHCCQPLMTALGIPATARLSFYVYNTEKDIEKVLSAIKKVRKIFSV
jgi:cysteine desulfurase/selenocysteine lyase